MPAWTRNFPDFRNAVVHAATFVLALEEWLPQYQAHNTSGLCSPQGAIAAIEGGWPHKPAFSSRRRKKIDIDLRCNPRTPPAEGQSAVRRSHRRKLFHKHPELRLDWEMITPTRARTPIPRIGSCNPLCAAGSSSRPHHADHALTGTSGQTDASALRRLGIRRCVSVTHRCRPSAGVAGVWRTWRESYSEPGQGATGDDLMPSSIPAPGVAPRSGSNHRSSVLCDGERGDATGYTPELALVRLAATASDRFGVRPHLDREGGTHGERTLQVG